MLGDELKPVIGMTVLHNGFNSSCEERQFMTVDDVALGGRLPLYDRAALEPAQRELFDWQMGNAVPWATNAGFQAGTETGRLIGPFNPALLTPAISKAFMDFVLVEHESTSLSIRAREVVILTVGAAWQAPYELYAHCAVGRHVGLSDDQVRTLAEGGLPKDLSETETAAHRVARALTVEHRLDDALYREAEKLLGATGIMDAVVLTGIYHTVSAILTAFAIPAPLYDGDASVTEST
jgi:4-carboxymuconolactone decarboxylase